MPLKDIDFLYLRKKVEEKDMAVNQIRKYIWLVDTLRRNGKLTFKDLNDLWLNDEIRESRTFNTYFSQVAYCH